jgi:sugar fermentation stimulation protein A
MKFPQPLLKAQLVKRYKRFLADVIWPDGREETVHCPNPGAMTGLADTGMEVYVSDSKNPKRKLPCTLEAVICGRDMVLVNTSRPNSVVEEALLNGLIPELAGFDALQREVPYGEEKSRIDFVLTTGPKKCFVEVKGVTLAEGAIGYFPDSVTSRGAKHLRELGRLSRAGFPTALVFLVCRPDVEIVRPAERIDPVYARSLRTAKRNGVEILAYGVSLDPKNVTVTRRIPVQIHSRDKGPAKL